MSEGPGRRHRSHWIKPYLKAEMVYGLQVLLFIVQEVNSGTMSKKEAEKNPGGQVCGRSDGQPPVCSGCTKRTDCKSSVFEGTNCRSHPL
jgi:hypothetical protein